MSHEVLAISNYRVSSDEQLKNNSLVRQEAVCQSAAERLNLKIVKSWSGSVSSKAGTNVARKDLLEMLEFCKINKRVKYAIFDEYDRFMRSVNEGPYFEVLFQQLGVKVWYASESDTFNGNDAMAKFMRTMSAFKAEGSNEERQRKSISSQTTALKEGRYTFNPKPGYHKVPGTIAGVHDIHPVRGPALQKVLKDIAYRKTTTSQALINLNNSPFMKGGHSLYKMDKFRKIATDPYYAGVIEIKKQIHVRNENGLHKPLISLDEHNLIVEAFEKKPKNQKGPRKNGNPLFPISNSVSCKLCADQKNARYVGLELHNGKKRKMYEKYRCRACKRYISKDDLHKEVFKQFKNNPLTDEGKSDVIEAIESVWKQEQEQSIKETSRINSKISQILQCEI
jgi:DNA invertase Pin-like site-specific DNA recombinase